MRSARVLSALVVLTALLASTAFAAGTQEQPKGPQTIKYIMWEDPTYKNIVQTYNAAQEQIVVDAQVLPSTDYETKLTTMLAGGAQMDAYMQKRQTDMFTQYANGYIAPLDELITKYKYDTAGIDRFKSAVTVDGKTLAVPFRGAEYYTYYNRKLFAKAGIDSPDVYVKNGAWTWKKFVEVSEKLSSGDGSVYGGLLYTWAHLSVLPAIQANVSFITAAGRIDFNDVVIQSFKMRKELESKKAIMSLVDLLTTRLHYSNAFFKGNVGMVIVGEWFPGMMVTARDKNQLEGFGWNDWGVTRMPCDLPTYASIGSPTFSHVSATSKQKDAAFAFIGWMGSAPGAAVVAKAGFLPALVTPDVKNALKTALPDDPQNLTYFAEPVKVLPAYYTRYGSRVEALINDLIQKYLLNDMTDDQIKAAFMTGLQEIIDTSN
jgi:multiple sugar transport system substrate-binding protein